MLSVPRSRKVVPKVVPTLSLRENIRTIDFTAEDSKVYQTKTIIHLLQLTAIDCKLCQSRRKSIN